MISKKITLICLIFVVHIIIFLKLVNNASGNYPIVWPHLALISGKEQIQTRVIRYPNTRVRISKHVCLKINFQKNTVLEQMFINKWPVLSSVFSCLETLMKNSPSFINKLQNRKFFARNFIHSLLFPLESHSFVVLMHFCNVGMASI